MENVKILNASLLRILTFFFICFFSVESFAQDKVSLNKGEKITKENNKYGIKNGKEWTLPCKYEKLEAYASNYVFAYNENEVDVYENTYSGSTRKLLYEKLPIHCLNIYKSFANTKFILNYAYGKWGFSKNGLVREPQYDSLFVICLDGSKTNSSAERCGDLIGVVRNGKIGVLDCNMVRYNWEIPLGDFTGIKHYYDPSKDEEERFPIVCTHISGAKVFYYRFKVKTHFAEAINDLGLKGYIINGEFLEPKYTSIKPCYLNVADFECTLPDGSIEYRKGVQFVSENTVKEYAEKLAEEERIRISEAKKREEMAQKVKEQAAQYTSMGLPIEIKTPKYTLNVYPGWAGIFNKPESSSQLLSSNYGNKKPAEIFKDAPEGWLRSAPFLSALQIMFYVNDSSSLKQEKEWFLDLANIRTGWSRDKIKPLEEQFTLPDGRKGLLLFYVCPDVKGMVGGNYFDCNLYLESENNKITVYKIFIDGGTPALPQQEAVAWKDYFKKILLSIRPN